METLSPAPMRRERRFDDRLNGCAFPSFLGENVVRARQRSDAALQNRLCIGQRLARAEGLVDDCNHHGEAILDPVFEFLGEKLPLLVGPVLFCDVTRDDEQVLRHAGAIAYWRYPHVPEFWRALRGASGALEMAKCPLGGLPNRRTREIVCRAVPEIR